MKMEPPTVIVEKPRRRGRPGLSDPAAPSADVHLTMSPEDYDRAYALATKDHCSVQTVIRRALKRLINDESGLVNSET